MKNPAVRSANLLLPAENVDPEKWAVVAVDQYTSQPEYWDQVEQFVGDAPSTLRVTLPEVYLKQSDARIPAMQACMRAYLSDGTLRPAVTDGYLLVERSTQSGARLGLMACLDLEQYDFSAGSRSLIRATEGTVIERVPPRVKIRRGAALELPHVLMLLDDPACSLIEPLYAGRAALESAYDFELMQGGGHLRGWKVEGAAARRVEAALDALYAGCGGLFLAVGDGNHSLAAARSYWLELRKGIPEADRASHPARYALVEIENLHSPAIQFEPIHRLVTGVDPEALIEACAAHMQGEGAGENELTLISRGRELRLHLAHHPLRALQAFLDDYLAAHPEAEIDYIHGDETLRRLASRPDAVGFMPCAFAKADLFPYIQQWGVLPRKTFSMGQAHEKRYYMEARRITQE